MHGVDTRRSDVMHGVDTRRSDVMHGVDTGQFDSTFQVAELHVTRLHAVNRLFVRRSLGDGVASVAMSVVMETIVWIPTAVTIPCRNLYTYTTLQFASLHTSDVQHE